MSGSGAPQIELPDAGELQVGVVASMWHERVMGGLLDGALGTLEQAGVPAPHVVRVPGVFELPLAARDLAGSLDAVVALGVVIRGGTPHFDYVCQAATSGLMRVGLDTRCPIGFGLLTCDNEEQALDRAGLEQSSEDKGTEATTAALTMALRTGQYAGSSVHRLPSYAGAATNMKSFEELFGELQARAAAKPEGSGTVRLLDSGTHAIGKKVVEEAAEVWMAAEHEGRDRTAEEIAQLIYHVQVLMVACDVTLDDLYRRL